MNFNISQQLLINVENDLQAGNFLEVAASPCIVVVGIICNMLSIAVFLQKEYKNNTIAIFFIFLSIADSLVLLAGLLPNWIFCTTNFNLHTQSSFSCKAITVICYTASVFSAWTIVAVAIERVVAVTYPRRVRYIITRKRCLRVAATILLVSFLLNLHFAFTVELSKGDGLLITERCGSGKGYEYIVEMVWPCIDSIIYSFLPSVLVCYCNVRIIITYSKKPVILAHAVGQRQQRRQNLRNDRMFLLLVSICVLSIVTTYPLSILTVMNAKFDVFFQPNDFTSLSKLWLIRTVFELLMYLNHVLNFFLYYLSSSKFRKTFLAMLKRTKDKRTWSFSNRSI